MKKESTVLLARMVKPAVLVASIFCIILFSPTLLFADPSDVKFVQSKQGVDVYDFVEIALEVGKPDADNPFTDVSVKGWFSVEGGRKVQVDGFCDSVDGSVFRIRFMPTHPGSYSYSVKYQQDSYEATHAGNFIARDAVRRGLIRVDKEHRWHFIWEGTGEHYFWNGTTTYWLLGWDEENIRRNIERLHGLKVNRLRVAINGRVENGRAWFENVFPTEKFKFRLNPWVAERPDGVENPGFDVKRFNVAYWQKIERMLSYARERDMIISIIFYVDGARPGVDPFGKGRMGQEDEQRYYNYGVARLAAYSNVMWDVTNEYHLFRNEAWTNKMGDLIKKWDPYDHVMSVHGHGAFPFRTSSWADFAMYQQWDESGGYNFMLQNRRKQAETGRPMPQINEEYGYEDHYPTWGGNRKAPARSADNRRHLAWGMYMAGCYQTTGERADTGTGWGPDTGGGWINGRGDASMIMLKGYGHIVDFFTSIRWWELYPDSDFFETQQRTSVQTKLSYVVYTRDKAGRASIFLDAVRQASMTVAGNTSNWGAEYRLALANELTRDRPWLGEYHRVAIYDRALSPREIGLNFKRGPGKMPTDAQALYNFREGSGNIIKDVSNKAEPLNLKIEDTSAIEWLQGGGLLVRAPVLIASAGPAAKISGSVKGSNAITIEAWIKPANTTQAGPARIVTVSRDTGSRNFTLGQKGGAYEVRLRTTSTSPNGEPALSSPGADDDPRIICGMRSKKGDLAVVYFPVGGEVTLKPRSLDKGLEAQWFNPRSGERMSAKWGRENTFAAPDEQDWVLLLDRK